MSDGKFPSVTQFHANPAWTGCEQTFNFEQRLAWNFLNDNSECPGYTLKMRDIIESVFNLPTFCRFSDQIGGIKVRVDEESSHPDVFVEAITGTTVHIMEQPVSTIL